MRLFYLSCAAMGALGLFCVGGSFVYALFMLALTKDLVEPPRITFIGLALMILSALACGVGLLISGVLVLTAN